MKRLRVRLKRFFNSFSTKYRVQISDMESFEQKRTFSLSARQIFVAIVITLLVFIILTIYLVAFTGLREYIPGYADQKSKQKLNDLLITTDSLENKIKANEQYIINLQNVFTGKIPKEIPLEKDTTKDYRSIKNMRSKEDSLLRQEVQDAERYNVHPDKKENGISNFLFFTPVRGKIIQPFNLEKGIKGITITTSKDEAIKSVLEGTVLWAAFTPDDNYVIAIQHNDQFVSIYKHCSTILKKEGDFVKAGEPLGFSAQTNGIVKDPFLMYELWYRGIPVDPTKFILF